MKSLAVMSILIATLVAPALAARDPRPRRGFGRMLLFLAGFTLIYVIYLSQIHARLFVPERWTQ